MEKHRTHTCMCQRDVSLISSYFSVKVSNTKTKIKLPTKKNSDYYFQSPNNSIKSLKGYIPATRVLVKAQTQLC